MPAHPLGEFYEGFSSFRRMLAKAPAENWPVVFANCVSEAASYVQKGLDKVTAVDELVDMAASIGFADADQVQKMLADNFAEFTRIGEEVRGRRFNGPGDAVEEGELAEASPDIDLNRDDGQAAPASAAVVPLRSNKQSRAKRGNGPERRAVPPKITALAVETFMLNLTQPEYLIDTILQRRFLYSLTGKTGSGKTALALYITACVALGRPIGDLEVMQGNVLYLAGENPDDIRYRWCAMGQQMDFDYNAVPVWFVDQRCDLTDAVEALTQQMGAIGGVSLVVIDTAPAYFQGDDVNSNTQQGDHARTLRGLIELPGGPTVLALTHPVKRAAADDLIPLGAGSFLNEVDGNLTCAVDGSAVELHWQGKIRGPDFAPLNFELKTVTHERLVDSRGRLIPTVVAKPLSDAAREGMEKAASGGASLLLAEIDRDGRSSVREYATALGWLTAAGKPHSSKVQRALGKLKSAKMITKELDIWKVTKVGQKHLEQSGTAQGDALPVPA